MVCSVLLFELYQRVAQSGLVERGAGFENQLLLRGLKFFGRDFGWLRRPASRWPVRQWRRDQSRATSVADICASGFAAGNFRDLLALRGVQFAVKTGEPSGQRGERVFVAFAEGDAEQKFVES